MHPMLNIAVRAARAAGSIISRGFESQDDLKTEAKGLNDFVTRIDKEAEAAIIEKIQQSYPTHSFICEESGVSQGEDEDYKWVIDPLDGTTNFIKGIPHFSVSIALYVKGKCEQAVVFDPIRGDLFTASKGSGAQLNGYRIRVGSATELGASILATAFPFKNKDKLAQYMASFTDIFSQAGDIRRTGSAALDLAYVAANKFDGYWESGLKPWDIAAGSLIVQEAGGLLVDFTAGNDSLSRGEVIAGNPKVVKLIAKALN